MATDIFSLKDRCILITGASSGIGMAVAQMAAIYGAKCVLCARSPDKLESVRKVLSASGHIAIVRDLHDESCGEIVCEAVGAVGALSGFVHCAGIEKTLPFRVTDISDFREIMNLNVESYWLILRELLKKKHHIKGQLSVVAMSSSAGIFGSAGKTAYSASKGALISLTKSLAAEYAGQKIRFNCVAPGYVDTPMLDGIKKLYKDKISFDNAIVKKHALGLGMPQDIAAAAVYLLSDASRWMTGSVMNIDGGYNL